MEFYLSFTELLGKSGNPLILIFLPRFLVTTLEALLIMRRQGSYPWQNAGPSLLLRTGIRRSRELNAHDRRAIRRRVGPLLG
jgi:hypothetical protein